MSVFCVQPLRLTLLDSRSPVDVEDMLRGNDKLKIRNVNGT